MNRFRDKFVLLSTQRSGSTWIMDTLNSQPQIVAYTELFWNGKPADAFWLDDRRTILWQEYSRNVKQATVPGLRIRPIFRYLDKALTYEEPNDAVIGFSLKYSQVRALPEILVYLSRRQVLVLHVVRRNGLDIVVSTAVRSARDLPHTKSADSVESVRVHIDAANLVADLRARENKIAWAKRLMAIARIRRMEIVYEDLVSRKTSYDDILGFLGLPDAGVHSEMVKLVTSPHSEIIENYEEVKQALDGTRYSAWLRQ